MSVPNYGNVVMMQRVIGTRGYCTVVCVSYRFKHGALMCACEVRTLHEAQSTMMLFVDASMP